MYVDFLTHDCELMLDFPSPTKRRPDECFNLWAAHHFHILGIPFDAFVRPQGEEPY